MDISRYSAKSKEIVQWAEEEARELRQPQIGTHHFLIALVRAEAFPGDLRSARLSVREATLELQPRADELPDTLPMSFGARQFLERAESLAGDGEVQPEHLAESMKRQSGHVVSVLLRMGIPLY